MSPTESALQKLVDLLQTAVAVTIKAHPTVYDNCPDPQLHLLGAPDLRRASQMPILAVDLDREELSTRTMGGAQVSRRQRVIPAVVYIYHAHRDEDQLYRQLLQICDAVIQTLEEFPQTAEYLYQHPRLVDLSPPIESPQQPYIRVAAISLAIITTHRQGQP